MLTTMDDADDSDDDADDSDDDLLFAGAKSSVGR